MVDDVELVVGGRSLSGWTRVRVTRGAERCPNDFAISLTDLDPESASRVVVKPYDACELKIGGDLAITGFVDRMIPTITPTSHDIAVVGRGKCQDLVDCSAEWPGGQIKGQNAFGIAKKLALAYQGGKLLVRCDVLDLPIIPNFNLMLGEAAFEIIERVSRYSALLAYESTDGNLLLTRVGTATHASGFEEGKNIQEGSATFSGDQRYSQYFSYLQSVDVFTDLGHGGNLLSRELDATVPRHRRLVVIAEAATDWNSVTPLAVLRARWEKARRFGRSFAVTITTDSWRDEAGLLWTPNMLVPIESPFLKIGRGNTDGMKWVIAEVTYNRDEQTGTTATLTMMPPAAFNPQPILLAPAWLDIPVLGGTP